MSLIPWKWGSERTGMTRTDVDPFLALQREINRAFEAFWNGEDMLRPLGENFLSPRMDVSETDDSVHVTVELPGLNEKDIEVELRDDRLRISGVKKDERETKEHNYHRMERVFGSFERVVALPAKVKREGAEARFKDGVLTVTIPKAEPTMTKVEHKIPVKGG
ncbi:MAG: molecular chaperone Hsp20 [Planctomycetaceae bacterium]|nr:MAG: molecular chaperone Hsp20 [Planctomycetaceae bacterium]